MLLDQIEEDEENQSDGQQEKEAIPEDSDSNDSEDESESCFHDLFENKNKKEEIAQVSRKRTIDQVFKPAAEAEEQLKTTSEEEKQEIKKRKPEKKNQPTYKELK